MGGAEGMNGTRIPVLPPLPFEGPLDYLAPEGLALAPGTWVETKIMGRRTIGVVWDPPQSEEGRPPESKLKPILRALDLPPMRAETRRFLERMADYTLTPLGMALRLGARAPGLEAPPQEKRGWRLAETPPPDADSTPARRRVLAVFENGPMRALSSSEIAMAAGVSAGVVQGLAKIGALIPEAMARKAPGSGLKPDHAPPKLNPDQAEAAAALRLAAAERRYQGILLDGATGSGKTETYLEAVAETIRQGRQALVLLPEIALTADFASRVERRFGAKAAEWHSGLSGPQRTRLWRSVAGGETQVVIGARSALFLPFANLGLAVVDEEHDSSYKQEEVVLYSARDMAVLRGATEGFPVVLVSATPSLETWANAESGRYRRLSLPIRHGGAKPPEILAVDLRLDPPERGRWLSPKLVEAAKESLERGEQALFFLNRRGYAPLTICRTCGWRAGCPHCSAWLVEHRARGRLVCHHCGHAEPIPLKCPKCGAEDQIVPVGPGVERVAEEARALFPEARLAVLSSDLMPDGAALRAEIARIAAGEADLIVGTQIVAKGHHFPNLTMMGVVDADIGLQGGDLRAGERTVQLLLQAAGRVGRAEKPGRAFLQTTAPDHPVMRAILSGDGEAFRRAEAESRRETEDPPYGRLVAVIVAGESEEEVRAAAQDLARRADPILDLGATLYGPAPAPFARLRGKWRMRLLARFERALSPQNALRAWRARVKPASGVRIVFDVDPQSFL